MHPDDDTQAFKVPPPAETPPVWERVVERARSRTSREKLAVAQTEIRPPG
jgi:hypothetical protein